MSLLLKMIGQGLRRQNTDCITCHGSDEPLVVSRPPDPQAIEMLTLEERIPTMDDRTAGGAGSPEPPPKPPRADPIAGELVTETLDYDGGRQVTVYVPPDPPQAVVFTGDGQGISQW